jgi:hypothetical protein
LALAISTSLMTGEQARRRFAHGDFIAHFLQIRSERFYNADLRFGIYARLLLPPFR